MSKAIGAVLLILGLLILMGSIAMYIAASSTVNDYETTMGQFARSVDEEAEAEYNAALGMQMCSGIGIAIGGILSLLGGYLLLRPEPQKLQPPPQYPPQPYPYPPPQQYQQPPPPQSSYPCQTCGQPLKYVSQFQKWYCDRCRKYV